MSTQTTARTSVYAPRNALNAAELKSGIAQRSQARNDTEAVRAWLLNHFLRHLVGNFEPAQRIESLAEAQAVCASEPVPQWVPRHLERASSPDAAPLVWLAPNAPELLALETRLVEFLGSRIGTPLEGKLQRINCPQALALWDREHAELAARSEHGWRQSSESALRTLLRTEQGRFVELLPDSPSLRAEMAFESYAMRHCVGQFADRRKLSGGYGEHYAAAVENTRMRLLSFRDAQGKPHITISLLVADDGRLSAEQVKGKQNRPPIERYTDSVIRCLNHLDIVGQTPADCLAIGVVRTVQGWQRVEDVTEPSEQLHLITRHPILLPRITASTPAAQWLVAAQAPELLQDREDLGTALRYALGQGRRPANTQPDAHPLLIEGIPWPGLSIAKNRRQRSAS